MRMKSNWLGWSCCLLLLLVGVISAAEPHQTAGDRSPRMILPEPATAPAIPAGLPQEHLPKNISRSHDAITGTDSASS